MKKTILTLIILLNLLVVYGQNDNQIKIFRGFQTGILGLWINQENKLYSQLYVRSEIGLDAGLILGEGFNTYKNAFLTPVITIEPRYYYNLNNRIKKNKFTNFNSANFVTLSLKYHPDWFVISSENDINVMEQVSIIPKWGIKRSIAQSNFNYEIGLGLGKVYYFSKKYGYSRNYSDTKLDLHIRIGYNF